MPLNEKRVLKLDLTVWTIRIGFHVKPKKITQKNAELNVDLGMKHLSLKNGHTTLLFLLNIRYVYNFRTVCFSSMYIVQQ